MRYSYTSTSPQIASRYPFHVCASVVTVLLLLLAGCGGESAARARATPTPTSAASVVYVALGASDAVGVGADDPNTQAYVPLLIARLPKGARALNLGISGIHLHDALAQEMPAALAAHPTLVTVWLVGNDFRDCTPLAQYAADLDTLLAQLHDKTQAQVFVGNVPDMSLLPAFQRGRGGACVAGRAPVQIRALVQQWNATINPIITRRGAALVDLYNSDLASHPDYVSSRDGFHPSSAGYARLADLFWAQVTAHHAVPTP